MDFGGTINKGMDGVQISGEIQWIEGIITSPDGSTIADLREDILLTEIVLFEHIFRSSMSGTLVVTDTMEIISKFPFMGQEILTLRFKTPSPQMNELNIARDNIGDFLDFTTMRFIINKVPIRGAISNGAQTYTLHFVSEHGIIDNRKRISKSYVKSKSNIGEMVKDLLSNELGISPRDFHVEPTVGSRSLLVQNVNPTTFITRVAREAVSQVSGSPHYVFFSNKNGVHFRTLQDLYKQKPRGLFHAGDIGPDERIVPKDKDGASGKMIQNYRRILDYTIRNQNDLLVNARSGMIGGKVIEHNLFRKRLETTKYNYFSDADFNKYGRVEADRSNRVYTDIFKNVPEDEIFNNRISVLSTSKNSSDHDMFFEQKKTPNPRYKFINDQQSRFTELEHGVSVEITIVGYTSIAVGNLITLNLPTIGGDAATKNVNKLFSGDYLVKTLRHTISPPLNQHEIKMEVVKDGLQIPIEADTAVQ